MRGPNDEWLEVLGGCVYSRALLVLGSVYVVQWELELAKGRRWVGTCAVAGMEEHFEYPKGGEGEDLTSDLMVERKASSASMYLGLGGAGYRPAYATQGRL